MIFFSEKIDDEKIPSINLYRKLFTKMIISELPHTQTSFKFLKISGQLRL